jgi:hypothetical protein
MPTEQFSETSSSSESHGTDRSFPVSPSILYEQREMFIDMRCKSNYKSVTLSSIKSCHKKEGEASCHTQGKRGKTLRCHRLTRILSQEQIFMSM